MITSITTPVATPAAILLLGPIFVPLAQTIGFDLTQLGLVMVLTLAIGLYTPPVGTTLFIEALPALMMPLLIIVLLRFGFATPTEVSVVAVFYAWLAGIFIYRDMTLKRFMQALVAAGVATGVVMLVIMGSAIVGWMMTYAQVPQLFAAWCLTTLKEPWLIILAMIVIMLIAGMFIDLPAAILLLGPIFVPLSQAIGLDLTQLGVVMVLTLAIGLYTPPVGTTLFISSSIAHTSIMRTTSELFPFYFIALGITLAFAYVPALTL